MDEDCEEPFSILGVPPFQAGVGGAGALEGFAAFGGRFRVGGVCWWVLSLEKLLNSDGKLMLYFNVALMCGLHFR